MCHNSLRVYFVQRNNGHLIGSALHLDTGTVTTAEHRFGNPEQYTLSDEATPRARCVSTFLFHSECAYC